ncbi:hypothetical protein Syun_005424 [Stephania yunnanensis]|uniref:Myb/SANT-like domain-containing protein n=1 Tax=Stephania yunnanensis TaxID=152371 RepID=A0AAP0L669_9MAGN
MSSAIERKQMNTRAKSLKSDNQKPKQEIPRAKWTMYLSKILADLMAEQILIGNRQKSSFSKKAWRYICDEFHRKTGLKWEKDQLKNRHCVLRRHYNMVKTLLELPDFSWDESRRMVVASDQEHPDAEAIRINGCPIYKQLSIIFSDAKPNEDVDNFNDLIDNENESKLFAPSNARAMPLDSGGPSTFVQEDSSSSTEDDESIPNEPCKIKSPPQPGPCRRKKKRALVNDTMAKAILEMAASSKRRAAILTQGSDCFSLSNCVKALDEMHTIEGYIYYAALDLFESSNARETFMSLKVEKRSIWLKNKCNTAFAATRV